MLPSIELVADPHREAADQVGVDLDVEVHPVAELARPAPRPAVASCSSVSGTTRAHPGDQPLAAGGGQPAVLLQRPVDGAAARVQHDLARPAPGGRRGPCSRAARRAAGACARRAGPGRSGPPEAAARGPGSGRTGTARPRPRRGRRPARRRRTAPAQPRSSSGVDEVARPRPPAPHERLDHRAAPAPTPARRAAPVEQLGALASASTRRVAERCAAAAARPVEQVHDGEQLAGQPAQLVGAVVGAASSVDARSRTAPSDARLTPRISGASLASRRRLHAGSRSSRNRSTIRRWRVVVVERLADDPLGQLGGKRARARRAARRRPARAPPRAARSPRSRIAVGLLLRPCSRSSAMIARPSARASSRIRLASARVSREQRRESPPRPARRAPAPPRLSLICRSMMSCRSRHRLLQRRQRRTWISARAGRRRRPARR